MTEINAENVKIIPITNSSREISPEFQEFHDKMNGRPCTDMYDFKYVSKEEREKLNLSDAYMWKAIPKENITEDQKVKKHRTVNFKDVETIQNLENECQTNILKFLNDYSDDVENRLKEKIQEDIDKIILKRIMDYANKNIENNA